MLLQTLPFCTALHHHGVALSGLTLFLYTLPNLCGHASHLLVAYHLLYDVCAVCGASAVANSPKLGTGNLALCKVSHDKDLI